jgi:hypothetical protein
MISSNAVLPLPPVSPQDVVVGKIYFLLVRIKLKHMEVEIRRRETTGALLGGGAEGQQAMRAVLVRGGCAWGLMHSAVTCCACETYCQLGKSMAGQAILIPNACVYTQLLLLGLLVLP